jgi:hypothetical protein
MLVVATTASMSPYEPHRGSLWLPQVWLEAFNKLSIQSTISGTAILKPSRFE